MGGSLQSSLVIGNEACPASRRGSGHCGADIAFNFVMGLPVRYSGTSQCAPFGRRAEPDEIFS